MAPKDNTLVVTRAQLYEELWSTPLKTLAKKYGISDAALGKICRRLNVPRPGPGYWARIEAGHKPARRALPAKSRQQAYEIRPRQAGLAKFGMVQVLEQPHPLTRRTEQHFKSIMKRIRDADAQPLVSPPYCDHGRYECTGDEGFPVVVSLAGLDGALRLLDTWAKALERSGFVLRQGREKRLEAHKDGQAFVFRLREGYTKREFSIAEQKARQEAGQEPRDWEWVGSGKFTLTLEGGEWGTRREWTDRSARLEALLPEMLATLAELVPLTKKAREERLQNERIGAEESLRRWKEESRRDEEQRQLDNLVKAENELARSEAALRFLDRLDEAFRSSGSVPSAAREWLALARDIATRANPLRAWIEELRRLETHEPGEAG